jgi:hypothetical protein
MRALISEWPVLYISGTPPAADGGRQALRALDVEHDGAAGHARQHVLREQHHLAVGEDVLAVLGDDAQAVAVAVKGQAQLGVGGLQAAIRSRRFSGLLGRGGGWESCRPPRRTARSPRSPGAEDAGRRGAGHAVAAVHHDLHGRASFVAHDALA